MRFNEWLKLQENTPAIGVTPTAPGVAGKKKDPNQFVDEFQRTKFGTNRASFVQWQQQSGGVIPEKDISDLGFDPQSLVRSGIAIATGGNNYKLKPTTTQAKPTTSSTSIPNTSTTTQSNNSEKKYGPF